MDSDYARVLDGFNVVILDFDYNGFTSKDTVPPKAQYVLASVPFSKSIRDMNVKFDMTTIQKVNFGCLQAALAQDFFLAVNIDGLGQHMSSVKYRTISRYCL